MTDIVLLGADGLALSRTHLDYVYQGRMMLAAVQPFGSDGQLTPPYAFEYDPTPLPEVNSRSIDHWGFYNGAGNDTLLPEYLHRLGDGVFVHFPAADREPDFDHARASVLKKITYPTGGSTELEYELNEYRYIGPQIVASQLQFHSEPRSAAFSVSGNPDNYDLVEAEQTITISAMESTVMVTACVNGTTRATLAGSFNLPQIKLLKPDGTVVRSWQLEIGDPYQQPPYIQQLPCQMLSLKPGTYKIRGRARKFSSQALGADTITLGLTWSETVADDPVLRKKAGGLAGLRSFTYTSAAGRGARLPRQRPPRAVAQTRPARGALELAGRAAHALGAGYDRRGERHAREAVRVRTRHAPGQAAGGHRRPGRRVALRRLSASRECHDPQRACVDRSRLRIWLSKSHHHHALLQRRPDGHDRPGAERHAHPQHRFGPTTHHLEDLCP